MREYLAGLVLRIVFRAPEDLSRRLAPLVLQIIDIWADGGREDEMKETFEELQSRLKTPELNS